MEKNDRGLLIRCLPYGLTVRVLDHGEEKGDVEVYLKVYSVDRDEYVDVQPRRLCLRPMSR